MCDTLLVVTLVVLVSPKFQSRLVMFPVDVSLNVTDKGSTPLVGLPVKLASGQTVRLTPRVKDTPVAVLLKLMVSTYVPGDNELATELVMNAVMLVLCPAPRVKLVAKVETVNQLDVLVTLQNRGIVSLLVNV